MNFLNNMLNRIGNAFRAKPDPGYVHSLEEEAARLRAENRALLNSLLGTAGIPPLDPQTRAAGPATPPLRRRSWPQIATEREVAAARHVSETRPVSDDRHHRHVAPAEKPQ
jgi:hypothetical protein